MRETRLRRLEVLLTRKSLVSILPKVMLSKNIRLWLQQKSKFLLFSLDLLSQNPFGGPFSQLYVFSNFFSDVAQV